MATKWPPPKVEGLINHYYVLRRGINKVRRVKDDLQFAKQRATQGYSTKDTWSFDEYLAKVIAGGVKELRDRNFGYPRGLDQDEWKAILTDIVDGFELYTKHQYTYKEIPDKDQAKIDEAWHLLQEYFSGLWD